MLKERLEIARYKYNFPQPEISSRNFSLTTSISNVNRLFNSLMKHIKEAFRQNEKFLNIGCGQMVYKRVRNDSNYTIEDWKRDNPINNVMAEYIYKDKVTELMINSITIYNSTQNDRHTLRPSL